MKGGHKTGTKNIGMALDRDNRIYTCSNSKGAELVVYQDYKLFKVS